MEFLLEIGTALVLAMEWTPELVLASRTRVGRAHFVGCHQGVPGAMLTRWRVNLRHWIRPLRELTLESLTCWGS